MSDLHLQEGMIFAGKQSKLKYQTTLVVCLVTPNYPTLKKPNNSRAGVESKTLITK